MEKKEHGEGCCDSMICQRGCQGHGHHLIKTILRLIIVGIIFCYAFKLGEINGSLGSQFESRGYGMMNRTGEYSSSYGMMRGYGLPAGTQGSVTAPVQAQQ